MHTYGSDARDKTVAFVWLGIIAVSVSWIVHLGIERTGLAIPWCVDSPTPILVFWILYEWYDRRLWRIRIWFLHLSEIPDLEGTWKGSIRARDHGERKAVVLIRQRWAEISIALATTESSSQSSIASLCLNRGPEAILSYEYLNQPYALGAETMHMHRGFADLRIVSANDKLEGEYYSGRDRENFGTITLQKISRSIMDKIEVMKPETSDESRNSRN